MNRKMNSFPTNHSGPQIQSGPKKVGPAGPPRNSVTMIADIVTVFMNSARKNSAKRIEEYSVWNPPTSSCSASTRSKGGRLSSAVPAITKMMKGTTPVTTTFQCGTIPPKPSPAWLITMSCVDSDPARRTTATTDRPSAAS